MVSAIPNLLLAALPRKAYAELLPSLKPVVLKFGDVLYEPGQPIEQVYFPGDSMVSLLTLVEDHLALEVGLVGLEGVVGSRLRWASTARRCARWCRAAARRCA
jgi:hypothetical protein